MDNFVCPDKSKMSKLINFLYKDLNSKMPYQNSAKKHIINAASSNSSMGKLTILCHQIFRTAEVRAR